MTKKKIIALDEKGNRVGESHHNAKLSDEQVDWVRTLYEEGFVGARTLAMMCWVLWGVQVSREWVFMVCKYRRRACTPERYKTVYVEEESNC